MNRVEQQAQFLLHVCLLVKFATNLGYQVTGGELWRPLEMQKLYFQEGKSKTMLSSHLDRLAIDLNFFKDGVLIENRVMLKPIGDYWESLDEANRWGGSWRGLVAKGTSKFIDTPHFERKV